MSLIAGYVLCNQKERSEQKQLNHRFYSPFMILMMTSKCAKELWPKEKFNEIEKILDTKKKFSCFVMLTMGFLVFKENLQCLKVLF
ncbi:hypothetical protein Glove_680g55 [Diversispora epigaea]|uniref:Uncharacterized protein n=1 Tax=Diversispora epigaea TaxID=1348612 RepID=A0A397G433_9GLOM|nr:hypothetical protein Glove_680g55 [Diversispora epigaea]